MNSCISYRQLCAVALCALTAPVSLICAGFSWQWVLAGALAAGIFYWVVLRLSGSTGLAELTLCAYGAGIGRVILGLCGLYLLALLGYVTAKSTLAFPETRDFPWAGLLVLLLAVTVGHMGVRCLARCCGILLLLLGVIYAIVLIFSLPQLQWRWLSVANRPEDGLWTFLLLTLPTLLLFFRQPAQTQDTHPGWWVLLGGLFPVAVAGITAGCLSPALAAQPMSFYQLARSVSLLGVMERFEALVSAAYLIGFFCLAGLLSAVLDKIVQTLLEDASTQNTECGEDESTAVSMSQIFRSRKFLSTCGIFLLSFAAMWLCGEIPIWVLLSLGGIFCGLLPLLTLGIVSEKKIEKSENNA